METEWLRLLLEQDTMILMIPIVAILVGGIIAIAKLLVRHRERMTMIEHGIHPDDWPEDAQEDDEDMP